MQQAHKSLFNKKINTEIYVPKNPQILKSGDRYVVIYSSHETQEEAARTYKLIRINDPDLNPQILQRE